MRRRGPPLVLGLALVLALGCGPSSASDPVLGGSTDAAAVQVAERGSTDGPVNLDSALDAPITDGLVQVGSDSNEAGPAPAGDAREEAGSGRPSDGRNQGSADATDATSATDATDAGGLEPESGRLAGITAAHNAVRASVLTQPPLPPLVWNQAIADYAQQWATTLANTMCAQPQHRTSAELVAKGYGENLATFGAGGARAGAVASTAPQAVNAWAAEQTCWTFGTLLGTEKCNLTCYTNLHSDGCGHYTQIIWRNSTELGCGVGTCKNGALTEDIWICNYAPAGNFIGRAPY